ncbi:MucBP domain-containing protein [Lacticaseibacillus jixiensis]|uniref:MucBP domain-containing protein n=1 Tax=Lacticaseibacillus jixiensis TaxID=3231926 RepID=UPI0036F1F1F1
MSLLTRIKTWLAATTAKPVRRAGSLKHPHEPAPSRPDSRLDPSPHKVHDLPPATGMVDTRVQVRVYYQNVTSHVNLHDPITLHGHTGDPLPITWQVIAGFVLTEIRNFTQVFPANNQVIWCGYTPRVAGPVIVYHRDSNGHLLQVPELLQGVLNQSYTAQALPEFAEHVVGPTTQSGMFTQAAQSLRFSYNLTPLESGQLPDDAFIQLQTAKLAYPQPLAGAPYASQLPAHTYWRVYAVMRDTLNHTVWFNVGGSQWITADATTGVASDPYLPDPTPLALPHQLFASDEQSVHLTGTVLGDATVWAEPYGQMHEARLLEGTAVTINTVVTLTNGAVWYQVASGGYVLATFITIDQSGHTPAQPQLR